MTPVLIDVNDETIGLSDVSITVESSNYVWTFYRYNRNPSESYFDLDNSGTYVLVAYGNLDSSGSKIIFFMLNYIK